MRYLALLFLFPLSFACASVTTVSLANTSLDLLNEQCLNITDINTIINVPSVKTNDSINMTPYQVITNPVTNTIYSCQYDKVDYHTTLPFSGTFTNTEHNISVSCPAFPSMDMDLNLTAGETYYNSTYNLSVHAVYQRYNLVIPLNFSENRTYSEINLTISAPSYPKLNINSSLDFGGRYINELANISVIAPPYPFIGETTTIRCGQSKSYSNLGIYVIASACPEINKQLNYSEHFIVPEYNIDLMAPPKIDQTIALAAYQNYTNDALALKVVCEPTNEQFINVCRNVSESNLTRLWQFVNYSDVNFTCNTVAYACLDNLTGYCSMEEKFSGRYGFINCFNRNLLEMHTKINESDNQRNICLTEKNACLTATSSSEKQSENMVDAVLMIGGFMILTLLLSTAVFLYVRKQKAIRGETNG